MAYKVIPTAQFEEEYQRAVDYAVSVWGIRMQSRYKQRLKELWAILKDFPETFPKADYQGEPIRRIVFYGPMLLFYSVEEATKTVWLLSLWDGRREGSPRL